MADHDLDQLWRAVFGEPPAVEADPGLMCAILISCLPPAPPYVASERPAGDAGAQTPSEAPKSLKA
jgi:hypothetical protein